MEDSESNLLSIGRYLSREREIDAPHPPEESAGPREKVLLLWVTRAVEGFVGEKVSMVPRSAKTTDPDVIPLWTLGA